MGTVITGKEKYIHINMNIKKNQKRHKGTSLAVAVGDIEAVKDIEVQRRIAPQ